MAEKPATSMYYHRCMWLLNSHIRSHIHTTQKKNPAQKRIHEWLSSWKKKKLLNNVDRFLSEYYEVIASWADINIAAKVRLEEVHTHPHSFAHRKKKTTQDEDFFKQLPCGFPRPVTYSNGMPARRSDLVTYQGTAYSLGRAIWILGFPPSRPRYYILVPLDTKNSNTVHATMSELTLVERSLDHAHNAAAFIIALMVLQTTNNQDMEKVVENHFRLRAATVPDLDATMLKWSNMHY